jgi:hypothetical protein
MEVQLADKLDQYREDVFEYLEYIGITDYLVMSDANQASLAFADMILVYFYGGLSYRRCAIMLFSVTIYNVRRNLNELAAKNKIN